MDLAEVASAMMGRINGPTGGTIKFDLGSDGCLFVDGRGAENSVALNNNDPADCTIVMSAPGF